MTFKEKYGPWALVTGGTSGIGKAFAEQFAEQGLNLVLAARRQNLLEETAREIADRYGIQVETLQVDLSETAAIEEVKNRTREKEIGLFIPSAGIENHGDFVSTDIERERTLLHLNVFAPMELSHHFGQLMADRGRGGIIFVSSTLGYGGIPYYANYAASKAYVLSLGEGLSYELKYRGVDVTVLSPGSTDTPMAKNIGIDMNKAPMPMMSPETTAAAGLKALGRKPSVIPGFTNNILAFMSKRIMSRGANVSMFGGMMKKLLGRAA